VTIKEMRQLTPTALDKAIVDAKSELMNLRFQHTVSQLDNTNVLPKAKRQVAQLLTVKRENELRSK